MTVVAIDGPAGAGKSAVARAVARELGYTFVDTGALYRALTLAALRSSTSLEDEQGLACLARSLRIEAVDGRTLLDGEDVSAPIRDDDVTRAVSTVAAHPRVRSEMAEIQRSIAGNADVVMEGRDIGTSVFPRARFKFFLTASLEERARRRARDRGLGDPVELGALQRSLHARDQADAGRAASPLRKPRDAVEIDTTSMPESDVVAAIVRAVRASVR
jgi:CMP/dCMP kinase